MCTKTIQSSAFVFQVEIFTRESILCTLAAPTQTPLSCMNNKKQNEQQQREQMWFFALFWSFSSSTKLRSCSCSCKKCDSDVKASLVQLDRHPQLLVNWSEASRRIQPRALILERACHDTPPPEEAPKKSIGQGMQSPQSSVGSYKKA